MIGYFLLLTASWAAAAPLAGTAGTSALGEAMISLGAILLVCANLNRASGEYQRKLDRLLLYIGGVEMFGAGLFALESTPVAFMHSAPFYGAMARTFPIILIVIGAISLASAVASTEGHISTPVPPPPPGTTPPPPPQNPLLGQGQ